MPTKTVGDPAMGDWMRELEKEGGRRAAKPLLHPGCEQFCR